MQNVDPTTGIITTTQVIDPATLIEANASDQAQIDNIQKRIDARSAILAQVVQAPQADPAIVATIQAIPAVAALLPQQANPVSPAQPTETVMP